MIERAGVGFGGIAFAARRGVERAGVFIRDGVRMAYTAAANSERGA